MRLGDYEDMVAVIGCAGLAEAVSRRVTAIDHALICAQICVVRRSVLRGVYSGGF